MIFVMFFCPELFPNLHLLTIADTRQHKSLNHETQTSPHSLLCCCCKKCVYETRWWLFDANLLICMTPKSNVLTRLKSARDVTQEHFCSIEFTTVQWDVWIRRTCIVEYMWIENDWEEMMLQEQQVNSSNTGMKQSIFQQCTRQTTWFRSTKRLR